MPDGRDIQSEDLSAAGARPSLAPERPLRLLVCGAGGSGEGTLALLSLTPSEEISDRPHDPNVPADAYRPVVLDSRRFLVAEWPDARPDGQSVAVAAIADAAILVVDADAGPDERVHRHAAVLSLLAVPEFVLATRSGEPVEVRAARLAQIADAVAAGPEKSKTTSADRHSPSAADQFSAKILWLGAAPMVPGRDYVLRAGSVAVPMTVSTLRYRLDPASGARESVAMLVKGELGVCNLSLRSPVALDPFAEAPATGSFAVCERLPDETAGATLGIGTIRFALRRATNIQWQALDVTKAARAAAKGQKPVVLWLTGLSGSGKSTIANLIEKRLHHLGRHTYLLDGDNVRHGLNRDLGFTEADRVENIRRVAEVAKLFADAGLIVLVSFISPYRSERRMARELMPAGEFVEIFVDTPIAECARRDPKGLYAKARRGEIKNFTGIDAPYEPPLDPDLRLETLGATPEDHAAVVEEHLRKTGVIG